MDSGLVHVYCGDGKGKTTAAVGLAVRMAGAGGRVVFAQFFKSGASAELRVLERLPEVELLQPCRTHRRFSLMDEAERLRAREDYAALFAAAAERARQGADLLVLDEAVAACNYGMVSLEALTAFLRDRPAGLEVVLTGRRPPRELTELADYVTQMQKVKHPYDRGVLARRGVEF